MVSTLLSSPIRFAPREFKDMALLDQGLKVSVYLSGEGAVVIWLKSIIHF
jgi:hypothetical protein